MTPHNLLFPEPLLGYSVKDRVVKLLKIIQAKLFATFFFSNARVYIEPVNVHTILFHVPQNKILN